MRNYYLQKASACLIALATLNSVPTAQAQESEYKPLPQGLDFLAIKNVVLKTTNVLDFDQMQSWENEGMHAGIQSFSFTLFNCKEIQRNAPYPEKSAFLCEIKDMQGNSVEKNEVDLTSTFKSIKFTKNYSSLKNVSLAVPRGGMYKLTAEITPELYSYEQEFVLVDEPNMRLTSPTEGPINEIPLPELSFSSGYPYEPAEFAGEKSLHWQMVSVKSPTVVISEGTETFELKSETPTLAAIATLTLSPEITEPGEYQFNITSDYAPANRSFILKIKDVLEPELTFDKSIYTVGDKEAVIKVDMSYDYPFVGKVKPDSVPTVELCAELLEEKTGVKYSDEAWADSKMQCTAEIKVPLDKVTDETVNENEGKVPMKLSISFNGNSVYSNTFTIPFETKAGVSDIEADKADRRNVKYFNIFGVEVDKTYRGVVIGSDGSKTIR